MPYNTKLMTNVLKGAALGGVVAGSAGAGVGFGVDAVGAVVDALASKPNVGLDATFRYGTRAGFAGLLIGGLFAAGITMYSRHRDQIEPPIPVLPDLGPEAEITQSNKPS